MKCFMKLLFYFGLRSLVSGRCGSNLKSVISECIWRIKFMSTSFGTVFGWVTHVNIDDESTLCQVTAPSHCQGQCWRKYMMSSYGVSRPRMSNHSVLMINKGSATKICWNNFADYKIVTNSYTPSFRFLWFLVMTVSTSLFVYVTVNRLILYFKYTSKAAVEIAYVDKLAFPTVTVCNHNQFRYVVAI